MTRLLALHDPRIGDLLIICLLTGMRAGEAVGLVREDLVWKGNLGWFAWIRPNEVRTLKTDAAERFIPLHSALTSTLDRLPSEGRVFPKLSVNMVSKRFAVMAAASEHVAGVALPVAAKGQGLYEMDADHRLDYVEWFQIARTLGYLGRLRGWEERTAIAVVPYDRGVVVQQEEERPLHNAS